MRVIINIPVTIMLIILTFSACSKQNETLSVDELLDLGDKYLIEMNYEQAVVQFLKVIEVDPMNPRGYIGAAEAYLGLGQLDKAESILKQGLVVLPDDEGIINKLAGFASAPITDNIPVPAPSLPPPSEPEPVIEEEVEASPNDPAALRELSGDFFGELGIQNLMYEFREGDPSGNITEDFLGYTYISFDFVLSSIPPHTAAKIKSCGIWGWQETPFTEDEIIYNCMYATGVWGERDLSSNEPLTQCPETGFPTYVDDKGKTYQVCFVLGDEAGAAIGYCLANVTVA